MHRVIDHFIRVQPAVCLRYQPRRPGRGPTHRPDPGCYPGPARRRKLRRCRPAPGDRKGGLGRSLTA
jgi:hypothetical protein